MALKLNGSTGYLEYPDKIVTGFPFSMMMWVSTDSGGAGQFWLAQSQSNADRYAAAWLDANGSTKYANYRNPGSGDSATKTSSPIPSSTMRLAVVVFASTTSRTIYFGDNTTQAVSTASVTDSTSNHDRVTVGAWHYNGNSPSLFTNGNVAEAHFFNVALTSTDVGNLLADSVKPEAITGWVDGWTFKDYSAGGTYTSLGGTRTMTAVGGVSTSTATPSHPISRNVDVTITGIVGNAVATGSTATVTNNPGVTVVGIVGNAVAAGSTASIQSAVTVSGITGNAVADGSTASVATYIVTDYIINNTGTLQSSVSVNYSWIPAGRIGTLNGITISDGTGTTSSNGKFVTAIVKTSGVLLVSIRNTDATDDYVYYQAF